MPDRIQFYLPTDSLAVWQPASLPQVEEYILFQYLTDFRIVITARLLLFSLLSPKRSFPPVQVKILCLFGTVAARCWSYTDAWKSILLKGVTANTYVVQNNFVPDNFFHIYIERVHWITCWDAIYTHWNAISWVQIRTLFLLLPL